jgi:methylated-DNA-[protein]-cysteine S-methyltransferase
MRAGARGLLREEIIMDEIRYRHLATPIGRLLLAGSGEGLLRIEFESGKTNRGPRPEWRRDDDCLGGAVEQLRDYFAGRRRDFDLRLDPRGTEFQLRTWRALRDIPYGATATYADIARAIGKPKAVRAVGAANGRNPLPIVVPCHRVIGSDGSLTGFGGGTDVKRKLLQLEGALI